VRRGAHVHRAASEVGHKRGDLCFGIGLVAAYGDGERPAVEGWRVHLPDLAVAEVERFDDRGSARGRGDLFGERWAAGAERGECLCLDEVVAVDDRLADERPVGRAGGDQRGEHPFPADRYEDCLAELGGLARGAVLGSLADFAASTAAFSGVRPLMTTWWPAFAHWVASASLIRPAPMTPGFIRGPPFECSSRLFGGGGDAWAVRAGRAVWRVDRDVR
jgi:hypothetical protein